MSTDNTEQRVMKKVFIVDDNETNLITAKETLQKNYMVLCMVDADRMFQLLEKMTPDLILLDIEMPVLNGLDALRLIRGSKEERIKNLKVIFLTSHASGDNIKIAAENHADGFMVKPFVPSDLRLKVAQMIGQ